VPPQGPLALTSSGAVLPPPIRYAGGEPGPRGTPAGQVGNGERAPDVGNVFGRMRRT
jgi:hypothetical protein